MYALKESQLLNLKKHKYSTVNISLLDPLFQIWWNTVIHYVPLWVAPNLLTIVGLIVNALTSLILVFETNCATTEAPGYAWYLCALGLFIYQTLDAIDGKQARRTNTTSSLGELFDHGCDSITTIFISISAGCCFRLGKEPELLFFQCVFCCLLFYSTHWDAYITRTVLFGKFDVTECQTGLMLLLVASGMFGIQIWEYSVISNWTLKGICIYTCVILGVYNLITKLYSIITGYRSNNMTLAGAFRPLVPLLVFMLFFVMYIKLDIVKQDPLKIIFGFHFLFSKLNNTLIVSHMSKHPMNIKIFVLLSPLVILFGNMLGVDTGLSSLIFLIITFTDLMIYNARICQQLCNYLNIYLFKI
ncbi:cholinephosphotransferase 1 [Lepeophtheirus salmonis]|uniref:cholinephosphotransferase 1 n=1 Tax=Lepeophtheirus salmonis TaxID=72036 RepID=UPI001AE59630|nr:cholinephosphotransferase 1-like [Lepeophtheirus salmonis]